MATRTRKKIVSLSVIGLLVIVLSACASLIDTATARLSENLATAILNQDDPATVRDGAPAYLLMSDAQIQGAPNNAPLLLAGARLYSAYASAFVTDQARAQRLAGKALDYARQALCLKLREVCAATTQPYHELQPRLDKLTQGDVPVLYTFASTWAGWIQAHSANWDALAEVPKIEAMMLRIVALDETYDGGGAHLYLGIINSQLPPALGGRPEVGQAHFQRAIELSAGRNLMAKVFYARHYARLVFDRELHDRLLREVRAADPHAANLTLGNVLAQEQATALLSSADDFF